MFALSAISPPLGWGLQKPPLGVPIDRGHPLAAGLKWFVACNENAGTLANDRASFKRGVIANAATTNLWGARPGWLTFDGSDDNLAFPLVAPTNNLPQSISGRVVVNTLPTSTRATIWSAPRSTSDFVLAVTLDAVGFGGRLSFRVTYSGANGSWAAAYLPTAGVPFTFTMTYDGSDNFASGVTALVNGVKIARYDYSSSSGPQLAANQPWQIGALANGSLAFNGAVEWLGWWNRVLPPDQIVRLHAEPFGMF
jgi:hypothetical protein